MNKFVYEYWSRTELGRKMIASDSVSDSDLLFLIPNNVKRMHGLPLTRISGSKKKKKKRLRRRSILSFELFKIIEDMVEEIVSSKLSNDQFFDKFVDIKDVEIGEKNVFQPDFRLDTTVQTSIRPIMPFNGVD
jgi:hypothetical protein